MWESTDIKIGSNAVLMFYSQSKSQNPELKC